MRFPTDVKNKITYLTALSLFMAVAENAIPHPLPFFRLGLSTIPLLLALGMLDTLPYLVLVLSKWLVSALASGTLLSPFALMGLASSFSSGVLMYIMYKAGGRFISLYSVSAAGAALSGLVQIAVSAIILTPSVFSLLPLMLLFSIGAGIFTAFIALRLDIPADIRLPEGSAAVNKGSKAVPVIFILAVAAICICSSPLILLICFVLTLYLCKASGRRIFLHIYIITFLAIVAFSLASPSGKVLWLFVTEEALFEGVQRALMVITLAALSQCFTAAGISSSSYAGRVISISGMMSNVFAETKGRLTERIRCSLNCDFSNNMNFKQKHVPSFTLFCILSIIIALCLLSLLF